MTQTQTQILEAAQRLTMREGPGRLTLDAVAREAAISKGGLLYHYPNKEALFRALVERHVQTFETELHRAIAADPVPRGRYSRATLAVALSGQPLPETAPALLSALLLDPALLEPVRDHYRSWRTQAEHDGLEPGLGLLLSLAADGLLLADLLGIEPLSGPQRQALGALVWELTGGAA